jgi:rhomboid protease GluP
MENQPEPNDQELNEQDFNNPSEEATQNESFLASFLPQEGFFATPILLGINILVFILMAASGVSIFQPESEALIQWGANFGVITLEGEYWRMVTANFIHIGIIHLAVNMISLHFIGRVLEPIIGKWNVILAYLFTGVLAALTSLFWHSDVVSAGASGSLFGLFGAFLYLLTTKLFAPEQRMAIFKQMGMLLAFNLIYGMKEGIDNAAHIGGLVSGFIFMFIFFPCIKNPSNSKRFINTALLSFTGLILLTYYGAQQIPNTIREYSKTINQVQLNEEEALKAFDQVITKKIEVQLNEFGTKGDSLWTENIQLLKELQTKDFKEDRKLLITQFLKYCQIRKEQFAYITQGIKDETNFDPAKNKEFENKIEQILKEINKP